MPSITGLRGAGLLTGRTINAMNGAVVYVLRCADDTLYTGWTKDLAIRLLAHRRGRASKYTRSRLPCTLVAWWQVPDRSSALRDEAAFKRLNRREKVQALAASQVFERSVRNAPTLQYASKGRHMPGFTAPHGSELAGFVEQAHTSQIRLRTNKGDIVFTFYADEAPQHSAAFVKLAKSGFYDGLQFHRVEPGFVIQGGDPDGNGTGGPGYRLDAEFNHHPHVRGTVAMARSVNPNSAGSQFYICLGDARFLDKQYTVFGQTTLGLDVLDSIKVGDVMERVSVEPREDAKDRGLSS